MKQLLIFFLVSSHAFSFLSISQICITLPDINGTPASAVSPSGWTIWYSTPDIISGNGSYPGTALASISDVNGNSLAGGEMTFLLINGVLGSQTEGIRTQLTGLTPGVSYFVSVQWQQVTLDYMGVTADPAGGKLGMYLDGNLMELFESSGGLNDLWQTAARSFVATASTHTLSLKGELLDNSSRGAIVIDNLPCSIFLSEELVKFELVENDQKQVEVSWEVLEGSMYSSVEIERSADLKSWTEIASVSPFVNYVLDTDKLHETRYYRLKLLDENGTYDYSMVHSISPSNFSDSRMIIAPNPVEDWLRIVSNNAEEIALTSAMGEEVRLCSLPHRACASGIEIDLSSLPSGVYFIHTNSESKRFVKL